MPRFESLAQPSTGQSRPPNRQTELPEKIREQTIVSQGVFLAG